MKKETTRELMVDRIENYLEAKNKPTIDLRTENLGKTRKSSGATLPKSPAISQRRFDQLNKEDRGSRTVYNSHAGIIAPAAHVTVMDPRDIPDVVLPHISVGDDLGEIPCISIGIDTKDGNTS